MSGSTPASFISYSREDAQFAIRLTRDLKAAGANVWLDQVDIAPGHPWDDAIEEALKVAPQMLVIMSPASVRSTNVRDEIAYALTRGKVVIPIIYQECEVPLRLERKQRIDFRGEYAGGLKSLLDYLSINRPLPTVPQQDEQGNAQLHRIAEEAAADSRRLQAETEEKARLEAERKVREVRAPVAESRAAPQIPPAPERARIHFEGPSTVPATPRSIPRGWIAGGIGALALVVIILLASHSRTRPNPVSGPLQTGPATPQQVPGPAVTTQPPPAELPPQEKFWTDPATGLTWTAKDSGQDMTWQQAMGYCRNLRLAGRSDWRLPTVDELQGMYDTSISFTGPWGPDSTRTYHVKGNLYLTGRQWSSSPGNAPGEAWSFPFNNGQRFSAQIGLSSIRRALCVHRSG
jgi:hypothetical protein